MGQLPSRSFLMKWMKRERECLRAGTVRTKSGFLLFPKCINDEYRFFEHATWKEQFHIGMIFRTTWWEAIEWVDDSVQ